MGKGKGGKGGNGKGGKGGKGGKARNSYPGSVDYPKMFDLHKFDGTHFLSETEMIELSTSYGTVICQVIQVCYLLTKLDEMLNGFIDEAYWIQHVFPLQKQIACIPSCVRLSCTELTKEIAADENDVLNTLARLFTSGKPLSHICNDIVAELLNMLASQALICQDPPFLRMVYRQHQKGFIEWVSADQPRKEHFWCYPRIDRFEIEKFPNFDLSFLIEYEVVMDEDTGKYKYKPVRPAAPVPDEPPTV
jgi:hypothetical protein